jgi:integrase
MDRRSSGSSPTSDRGRRGGASVCLAETEIERLLCACSPRDTLLIATALYTGLRGSELLDLTWDDIDFGDGVIHVRAAVARPSRRAKHDGDRPRRRPQSETSRSSRSSHAAR